MTVALSFCLIVTNTVIKVEVLCETWSFLDHHVIVRKFVVLGWLMPSFETYKKHGTIKFLIVVKTIIHRA